MYFFLVLKKVNKHKKYTLFLFDFPNRRTNIQFFVSTYNSFLMRDESDLLFKCGFDYNQVVFKTSAMNRLSCSHNGKLLFCTGKLPSLTSIIIIIIISRWWWTNILSHWINQRLINLLTWFQKRVSFPFFRRDVI